MASTKEKLHLHVGDELQLQFIGVASDERYAVHLIGYLSGRSLLVTAPYHQGRLLLVREGQRFAVRTLQGGTVLGFMAYVLQSHCIPYPYLHLSYPTDIERTVVRNASRVSLAAPSLVSAEGYTDEEKHWAAVELIDLSTTGARLETPQELGSVGDILQLSIQLGVCGEEETLKLACCIRNVTQMGLHRPRRGGTYRYGVEFQSVDRLQKLLLHSYVLEQRINGGG